MQRKRILGALALILTLCFISSIMVINSDNDDSYSQDFVLGIPGGTFYLDANGGTCDPPTFNFSGGAILDESYFPTPVREGYTFAGWYWDKNCTDRFIQYASMGQDGDMTIYAKWVKTPTDGTVLSDDGNRLITAPSDAVNYVIPDGVTTIAGYAFFKCNNMQSIKFPESVTTLEAHTFDGLGLITVYIPYSATYMDQVPPFFNIVRTHPAPTADNYSSSDKFEIYTADEMVDFRKSIDSTRHYDGKIVYLARDIEMSGVHYDFPDTFNGTFDGQGHVISSFTSQMSSPLFRIIGSNGIVKNLGIFNAQVSSEGGSNAIMAEINNGTIVNCYANECNVSWGGIDSSGAGFVYSNSGLIENCYSNTSCNGNNTLCADNNGTVTNTYYLQDASHNGIGIGKTAEEMKDPNFATLLGNAYAPDTENMNNGYPIFAPISTEFTVTFNTNGGSEVTSQIVREGENTVRPADPTKQGFVFGGWYADSELTSEYTFTTPITQNTTLYAKWYENLVFTSVPSISDIKITIDGRTISASVAADNYLYILWDLGNGEIIRTYSNELTYTYAEDGDYTITATAVNSEGSSETIEYNLNIEDKKEQKEQSLIATVILFLIIAIVAFLLVSYCYGMSVISAVCSIIIATVIVCVLWILGVL